MKIFPIFLIILVTSQVFAVDLRSLHFEDDERLRNESFSNAVGLLVYKIDKTHWQTQSGFFYRPDLFITGRSPFEKDLPDCSKMQIHVGLQSVQVSGIESKRTFSCAKVAISNPRYGFLVIRVSGQNSEMIPIPSEEEMKHWVSAPEVFMLGYSRRGELLLSKGCKPRIGRCRLCERVKDVELAAEAWGEADCLFKKGMKGSPLFFMNSDRRWIPLGFMGHFAAASVETAEIGEKLSVVRLMTLQRRFGSDLLGTELKNERP